MKFTERRIGKILSTIWAFLSWPFWKLGKWLGWKQMVRKESSNSETNSTQFSACHPELPAKVSCYFFFKPIDSQMGIYFAHHESLYCILNSIDTPDGQSSWIIKMLPTMSLKMEERFLYYQLKGETKVEKLLPFLADTRDKKWLEKCKSLVSTARCDGGDTWRFSEAISEQPKIQSRWIWKENILTCCKLGRLKLGCLDEIRLEGDSNPNKEKVLLVGDFSLMPNGALCGDNVHWGLLSGNQDRHLNPLGEVILQPAPISSGDFTISS